MGNQGLYTFRGCATRAGQRLKKWKYSWQMSWPAYSITWPFIRHRLISASRQTGVDISKFRKFYLVHYFGINSNYILVTWNIVHFTVYEYKWHEEKQVQEMCLTDWTVLHQDLKSDGSPSFHWWHIKGQVEILTNRKTDGQTILLSVLNALWLN